MNSGDSVCQCVMCIVYVDYHKAICQLPSIAYEILKNRNVF